MTNGEAIMRIKEHMRVHHMGVFPHIKIAEALNMAISALATDNDDGCKWIPVTERLPEKGIDVLLYFGFKHKNQAVGFWDGSEEYNAVFWRAYTDDGFYTDCDYKPTHWMPLPTPPKDGE